MVRSPTSCSGLRPEQTGKNEEEHSRVPSGAWGQCRPKGSSEEWSPARRADWVFGIQRNTHSSAGEEQELREGRSAGSVTYLGSVH